MTFQGKTISIVVPFYNEQAVIPMFLARLQLVVAHLNGGVELIFVDDGSSDATFSLLSEFRANNSKIKVIQLSRNFGHQLALTAGLDEAGGEIVITMDGDLQDPPEVIPTILQRMSEGFDIVTDSRGNRAESWFFSIICKLFYRTLGVLSEVPIMLDAGDFAGISKRVADIIRNSRESHRFLRGLRAWTGFSHSNVTLDRPARQAGKSKYSVLRLSRLALNGLFASSTVPLTIVGMLGVASIALTGLFGLYSLLMKLTTDQSPTGSTALVLLILFCSGVQLLSLAVIGSYVGRIYQDVKRRPLYVINRIVQGPAQI